MVIGIVGLGRMEANIARRLARGGHRVVAFNRTPEKAHALAQEEKNVQAAGTLEKMTALLSAAHPGDAGAGSRSGLGSRRPQRRRPLRQDGP